MIRNPARERWLTIAGWFLVISYGVGAPLTAILEYRSQALSQRFDVPVELVYLTSAIQVGCALAVRTNRLASLAATALTITTIGAAALHVRIGSPLTAWPAILFTAIQVWFGLAHRATRSQPS